MAYTDHVHDFQRIGGMLMCSVCFRNPAEATLVDVASLEAAVRQMTYFASGLGGRKVA